MIRTTCLFFFYLLLGTAASQNLSSHIIAYWPFNGNTLDSGAYHLDGTKGNTKIPHFVTGRNNTPASALLVDSAYVKVAPSAYLDFDSTMEFSYLFWYRPGSDGCLGYSILSKRDLATEFTCTAPASAYSIYGQNTTLNNTMAYGDISPRDCGGPSYRFSNSNDWYCIAYVHKNDSIALYSNGVLLGTTKSHVFKNSNYPLWLSVANGKSLLCFAAQKAALDDLYLFNKGLSPAEIMQVMQGAITATGSAIGAAGKISYYYNAALHSLHVDQPEGECNITILDVQGKTQNFGKIHGTGDVNLPQLKEGLYFVVVESSAGNQKGKLIITR
jgi:hypothetical protein